ncbi:MAG: ABC transporter permease [Gemmatimonadota bacterium]
MKNLKLALRTLGRTPFVTAVAIASLALGIGANTAIFSMFQRILLDPLPVSEPGELINLSAPGPKPGSQSCSNAGSCEDVFSYQMFRDLERGSESVLTGLAGHVRFNANIAYRNQSLDADGLYVSGSYFRVLGVRAHLGRLLTPEDDLTIGGHFIAVLGHTYWETQLGSDPGVVGEVMTVNGQSLTIVGVAPPEFQSTTLGDRPNVFVPVTMRATVTPGWTGFDDRTSYWIYLFGRLKPGVAIEQASLSLNALYRPIIVDVEAPLQEGMSEQTMARFKARQVLVTKGSRGQSSIITEAKTPLLLLGSVTLIVLLIACTNVANLLLARGATRGMEMAVRLSLGAGRRQLVGQLLVEACVLAVIAGVVSLLVARGTLALLVSFLPPEAATSMEFSINGRVMAFAGTLSLVTGLLFGLVPALQTTRPDLLSVIKSSAGRTSTARSVSKFRGVLVTAQMALSMALLCSAGLFIRSLANVSRVDLGLDVESVVRFGVAPVLNGYDPQRRRTLFRRMQEELAAIPGVTGVTADRVGILRGNNWGNSVNVEGFREDPDTDDGSNFNQVGAGYFRMLGVPILAGREFTASDDAATPKVAIVNEAFARKFGLGKDAVGKRMSEDDGNGLDIEIVGLVRDAKYSEVKDEIPPQYFRPYQQDTTIGSLVFYVRSAQSPASLLRTIPSVVSSLDPALPVSDLKTMPQQIRENVFLDRMISSFSSAFAVLATLLAAVGLYGVLAYAISQRTNEIGVRMALGADGRRVRGMILKQVAVMTAIGAVIGIAAAVGIGKAAGSLLYGLTGTDPIAVGGALLVLALVAFTAGYVPARRASRVHPMEALRYE